MEKQLLLKKLEGKEAAVFFEKMYGKEGAKANKERYLHDGGIGKGLRT